MLRIFALPFLTLMIAFIFAEFDQPEFESTKAISGSVYPEHLTGAFTGGFGEETCRSCHFDYDLNPDGGSIVVSGIPTELSAGESIEISITVEREDIGAAGFQLSARYEDGTQAGQFFVEGDDRLMFSNDVPDSLQYVQHSSKGTSPSGENKNSWAIRWQAPDSTKGPVIFNIAANAGNGDQSEFGDYIYAKEFQVSQ
ncbi:hypothetical protein CK503_04590 [Aliifodinibius salipaludis]|uniref:Reelin domain-containing protein n=1 Tax=Fodinibius salipaludis TaxID=2032627 RepID=A0A2A2GAI0_9BACT|nr:choice-of-anchor V domain-containing protein [Aliifodinibius salipaludis]PAU94756.1 hypothetical protein CK503_04590 [Aliifodinibius salipaludis]